jgi:dihydroxyacetone kinase-like protein
MSQPAGVFTAADVRAYLLRCSRAIRRHEAWLTALDTALGDGDHGDNMALGFRAIDELVDSPGALEMSAGELLRQAGHTLVASVGGASGPLYGTAFLEAGFLVSARPDLEASDLAAALLAAADGLARRGRCQVGDKTILDTLRPAADAFAGAVAAGEPITTAARAMFRAAYEGMCSTRPLVARRGLALRLGARSAGHLDPGAVSAFLLVRAMGPDHAERRQAAQGASMGAGAA